MEHPSAQRGGGRRHVIGGHLRARRRSGAEERRHEQEGGPPESRSVSHLANLRTGCRVWCRSCGPARLCWLAIPPKRADRALISFLEKAEVDALLKAPDRGTWTGRRDHALLLLAVQTGLRASELTGLSCGDVHLGTGAHVSCLGKGRKQRITPLTRTTTAVLRTWLRERAGDPDDPLFPTIRGARLSRDALERRLAKHTTAAVHICPSLAEKRITLHVLRHTAAMRLLQAGVDTSVIALWLGHSRVDTTRIYLNADLALKERALDRTAPPNTTPGRYRPADPILAFLESL